MSSRGRLEENLEEFRAENALMGCTSSSCEQFGVALLDVGPCRTTTELL